MGRTYGKPFYFNYCTTSYDSVGTPVNASNSANSPGVSFATPASAGVDGTAVTVLSALAHDVHNLVIGIGGLSLNAGIGCALGDLLVDPAGGTSWASVWEDVVCGHSPIVTAANGLMQCRYEVPLYIKSGSSVGWRAKANNAGGFAEGRISMAAYGEPSDPRAWFCGQKVESLGNGANSNGVLVTPGNTGTFGSWTNIGSTTTYNYGAICLGVQGDTSAALAAAGYYVNIGYGSTKLPGTPRFYVATTAAEIMCRAGGFAGDFIRCHIAAGTQMQAQATQTSTASNTLGIVLYGVTT